MQTNKQTHKITDEQFIETYLENNGSPTKTANAIERKYGISYTRQSAQERAMNIPNLEKRALYYMEEFYENTLLDLTKDETLDKKSLISILNNKAKRVRYRLLHIRLDAAKAKEKPEDPEGYFEIDGKEFRF